MCVQLSTSLDTLYVSSFLALLLHSTLFPISYVYSVGGRFLSKFIMPNNEISRCRCSRNTRNGIRIGTAARDSVSNPSRFDDFTKALSQDGFSQNGLSWNRLI